MNVKRPKRQRLAFFPLKQSRENINSTKHQHKTARFQDIKKNETLVQLSDIPAQIFHENFCVIFTSPNSSFCETLMPWEFHGIECSREFSCGVKLHRLRRWKPLKPCRIVNGSPLHSYLKDKEKTWKSSLRALENLCDTVDKSRVKTPGRYLYIKSKMSRLSCHHDFDKD